MPRWIAFDQQTSSLLHTRLPQADRIETFGRGALDYALAKPGAVVTLLPSGGSDIGIAIFRRPKLARPVVKPATTAKVAPASPVTRASGFLGLSDEPLFEEDDPVREKKGWWRRFWDE
jgi:hypothetical protein